MNEGLPMPWTRQTSAGVIVLVDELLWHFHMLGLNSVTIESDADGRAKIESPEFGRLSKIGDCLFRTPLGTGAAIVSRFKIMCGASLTEPVPSGEFGLQVKVAGDTESYASVSFYLNQPSGIAGVRLVRTKTAGNKIREVNNPWIIDGGFDAIAFGEVYETLYQAGIVKSLEFVDGPDGKVRLSLMPRSSEAAPIFSSSIAIDGYARETILKMRGLLSQQ